MKIFDLRVISKNKSIIYLFIFVLFCGNNLPLHSLINTNTEKNNISFPLMGIFSTYGIIQAVQN